MTPGFRSGPTISPACSKSFAKGFNRMTKPSPTLPNPFLEAQAGSRSHPVAAPPALDGAVPRARGTGSGGRCAGVWQVVSYQALRGKSAWNISKARLALAASSTRWRSDSRGILSVFRTTSASSTTGIRNLGSGLECLINRWDVFSVPSFHPAGSARGHSAERVLFPAPDLPTTGRVGYFLPFVAFTSTSAATIV